MRTTITVNRKALKAALTTLKKVAGGKNISILAGAHFQSGPSGVAVTATNLTQTLRILVSHSPAQPGQIVLNIAGTLQAMKAAGNAPEVFIEWIRDDGHAGTYTAAVDRIPVDALPAEKFPELLPPKAPPLAISFDLQDELERAAPSISDDESRYFMNGIYLDREGFFITTDGRRLYKSAKIPAMDGYTAEIVNNEKTPATVTPEGAILAAPLVSLKGAHSFGIDRASKVWTAAGPNWEYWGQLIDAQFPNWRRVMPDDFTEAAGPGRPGPQPAEIVRTVTALHEATRKARTPNHALITSQGASAGPDGATKAGKAWTAAGPEIPEISLNAEFLADVAQQLDLDRARLYTRKSRPQQGALGIADAAGRICVIMPTAYAHEKESEYKSLKAAIPGAQASEPTPEPATAPGPEPKPKKTPARNRQASAKPAPAPEPTPSTPEPEDAPKAQETQPTPEPTPPQEPEASQEPAPEAPKAQPTEEEAQALLKAAILAVLKAGGTAEQVGSWIWCQIAYEDTEAREALKAAGFFWSKARKSWYYSPTGRTPGAHAARSIDPAAKYGRSRIQSAEEVTAC